MKYVEFVDDYHLIEKLLGELSDLIVIEACP